VRSCQWWSAESVLRENGRCICSRPTPGTEASTAATRKREDDAFGNTAREKANIAPTKKAGIVKII
jgi:hypothetical protein